MKTFMLCCLAGGVFAVSGCSHSGDRKEVRVSDPILARVDPSGAVAGGDEQSEKSVDGYLPGADKIYFVGDRKVVRHETDARPVLVPQATRRLLVGNPSEEDISLQPALLQRELAEELARSRQINQESRQAMEKMTLVSKELVALLEHMQKTGVDEGKGRGADEPRGKDAAARGPMINEDEDEADSRFE